MPEPIATRPDLTGQTVGQYRILARLGAGGMGEVYRAEHVRLRRQVALKFIGLTLIRDTQAARRLEIEARAVAALNHPNITTLFEFDADQGFMSLELVEGETLAHVLERGPVPAPEAVRVALPVARALGHAHARGVLHRDIKPSNILLGKLGEVKLTDFGIARVRDATAESTSGMMMGTAPYMSPERILGQGADGRADLFSLGVVMYEMLAGRVPWTGAGVAVLYSLLHETPAPIDEVRDGVPPLLAALIDRLMRKDPAERCASAEEVESHLLDLESQLAPPPGARRAAALEALTRPPAAPAEPPGAQAKPPESAEPGEAAAAIVGARRAPLLGREREFRELETALEQARAGAGRTVLIVAEAGMGKSRLLEEFRRFAATRGVHVLAGACEYRGGRNFQPFVEAIEQWTAGSDALPAGGTGGVSTDPLGPAAGAGETAAAPRSREELWHRLDTMLTRIAQGTPLVLVIEDLHWADEGTLAFFHHLARKVARAPILLLASWRPEEVASGVEGGALEDLLRLMTPLESFARLELDPLSLADTERLAGHLIGQPRLARIVAPHLHKRSQGNVFFTIEMVRLLLDSQGLDQVSSRVVTHVETLSLPRTVADVIARRLARVPAESRDLLDVAAVQGETFSTEVLEEATGMPRIALLRQLRELDRTLHLVVAVPGGYRFSHGLIREALRRDLPEQLRREYHAVVARVLRRAHADRRDYAAEIAGHLFEAEQFAEALPLLVQAARESERLFVNDRALELWSRAVVAAERAAATEPPRAELLLARGRTLLALGRLPEAREAALEALTEAERSEQPAIRAEARQRLGEASLEQGDFMSAETMLRAAAADWDAQGATAKAAGCHRSLGIAAVRSGAIEAGLEHFDRAVAAFSGVGDETELARVHMDLAIAHMRRGDFDAALADAERAVAQFERTNQRHDLARALMRMGSAWFQKGVHDRAAAVYEKALGVASSIGDSQAVAQLKANLGNVLLVQGQTAAAREAYQEALEQFREIGDRHGAVQLMMALGAASYSTGAFADAARSYRDAVRMREELGDRWGLANALDNLSETERRLGNVAEAGERARASLELRRELGDQAGLARSQLNLAAVHALTGDLDAAERALVEAERMAGATGAPARVAEVLVAQARLSLWRDDPAAALALLERARATASAAEEPGRLLIEACARERSGQGTAGAWTAALEAARARNAIADEVAGLILHAGSERASEPARDLSDAARLARTAGLALHELRALTLLTRTQPASADAAMVERMAALERGLREGLPEAARAAFDIDRVPFPSP